MIRYMFAVAIVAVVIAAGCGRGSASSGQAGLGVNAMPAASTPTAEAAHPTVVGAALMATAEAAHPTATRAALAATAEPTAAAAAAHPTATRAALAPTAEPTAAAAAAHPTATRAALATTDEPTPEKAEGATAVIIGGVAFEAEVADTPTLRGNGLGGRDSLKPHHGMLFIFPDGQVSSFWMKGMRFPLDFVWIGRECVVVDVTEGVPHAEAGAANSSLPLLNSAAPAAYTFEINAGEVERYGIEVGDIVRFRNIQSEFAKCGE